MSVERLKLQGADWARYFAPVAFCAYLAAICVALIVTSVFLHNLRDTLAVSAAAAFGLLLSGALGLGVLGMQLHELRYLSVATPFDCESNSARVVRLARELGWQPIHEQPGRRLEFRTADSMLQLGERVVVVLRERQVLIASICDPDVGFSLVGRRRCQHHRELVKRAVLPGQGIYAYVTLGTDFEPSEDLRRALLRIVREQIGAFAAPDVIQWAPGLPKTRSGKIMRRILRKIAANETEQMGDISALADPLVVAQLVTDRPT